MKTYIALALASVLVATASPALAAKEGKNAAYAQREASCKAQASKKFSAIHFIKRHDFVNKCMGMTTAKAQKASPAKTAKAHKAEPTTTGQSVH
jgi:hypothetical protein